MTASTIDVEKQARAGCYSVAAAYAVCVIGEALSDSDARGLVTEAYLND